MQLFHHSDLIPVAYNRTNMEINLQLMNQIGFPQKPSEDLLQDLITMWKRNIPVGTPLLKIIPENCMETAANITEQAYTQSSSEIIIQITCQVIVINNIYNNTSGS